MRTRSLSLPDFQAGSSLSEQDQQTVLKTTVPGGQPNDRGLLESPFSQRRPAFIAQMYPKKPPTRDICDAFIEVTQSADIPGFNHLLRKYPTIALGQICDEKGATLLQIAAAAGVLGIVRTLLANIHRFPEIFTKDTHGNTAMLAAAQNGHTAVATELIRMVELRPDLLDANHLGETPMSMSIQHGHADLVGLLLNSPDKHIARILSSKTGDPDRKMVPLLILAVRSNKIEIVEQLLPFVKKFQHLLHCENKGDTAFTAAIRANNGEMIDLLASLGNPKIFDTDYNHRTPLEVAAAAGNLPLVQRLLGLAKQFSILRNLEYSSHTALTAAIEKGDMPIIRLLCAQIDDYPELMSQNAIRLAITKKQPEVLELLLPMLPRFPELVEISRFKESFLLTAVGTGDVNIVRIILPWTKTFPELLEVRAGRTDALATAIANGHEAVAQLLIEHYEKNSLPFFDGEGHGLLTQAIYSENIEMVKLTIDLIGRHPEVLTPDSTDFNELHFAIHRKQYGIAALVLDIANQFPQLLAPSSSGDRILRKIINNGDRGMMQSLAAQVKPHARTINIPPEVDLDALTVAL